VSRTSQRFPPHLVEMLRDELETAGLLPLLDDPQTTDLMVNEDGSVWLHHLTRGEQRVADLTVQPDQVESLLGTAASLHGTVVTGERPILEATLPFHAARLEAVLPPLVTAPVLALRKPPAVHLGLDDLVANQTLPRSVADLLAAALIERSTCLIAGGVGSGKTTLANALLAALLAARPDERIVIIEEGARELQAEAANAIRLLTSGAAGVDMTVLVRTALRLNPSRILIGEVRGPEAMDFLRAANTGCSGSLLTIHANGARDALDRLDMLVQETGVPSQLRRIAEAVHLVAFVARTGARRRLVEVVRVDGLDRAGRPRFEPLYAAAGSPDPRSRPLPLDSGGAR
jgi:type IV secretion system protein VirB11